MRKLLAILILAPVASVAELSSCPEPLTGYEEVVPIDIPGAEVEATLTDFPAVFSTAVQGSDDTIEDFLAAMSGANPEYRMNLTDTSGTEIPFAQVEIDNDSAAVWTIGFLVDLDGTDGARVCAHIDTDESLGADASDCTSSGAFAGYQWVYIGGSTVNWANCGSNALSGTNSPTSGTGGPFHGSFTYNGTNQYHTAAATGSGDEFEDDIYSVLMVVESSIASDSDTSPRFISGRQPYTNGGTHTAAWTHTGSTTRNEFWPAAGATGAGFNTVAADTIAVIGLTQDSATGGAANQTRSYRDGVGVVFTWNFAPQATNVTDDLHIGQRGNDSQYWPGTFYGMFAKPSIFSEDYFNTFANMAASTTAADDFFTVGDAMTYPSVLKPIGAMRLYRLATAAWTPAPASSADACDQVFAALGYDAGSSTPSGNQFIICSPEGERLRTGFDPE